MQKIFISLFSLFLLISTTGCAQNKNNNNISTTATKATQQQSIQWKTFEEVEALMKTKPKKVLIDVYTDWCSWCKKLDKEVYENPKAIEYINEHFYAIKFNAEQKEPITFMGKTYKSVPTGRSSTNQLAIDMMNGQLSYPTTIFMEENFTNPVVQPGFLKLNQMESILKFLGSNAYKTTDYQNYASKNSFNWK